MGETLFSYILLLPFTHIPKFFTIMLESYLDVLESHFYSHSKILQNQIRITGKELLCIR